MSGLLVLSSVKIKHDLATSDSCPTGTEFIEQFCSDDCLNCYYYSVEIQKSSDARSSYPPPTYFSPRAPAYAWSHADCAYTIKILAAPLRTLNIAHFKNSQNAVSFMSGLSVARNLKDIGC